MIRLTVLVVVVLALVAAGAARGSNISEYNSDPGSGGIWWDWSRDLCDISAGDHWWEYGYYDPYFQYAAYNPDGSRVRRCR